MKACFSVLAMVLLFFRSASAEQITSACRVTAIDAANRTVTLVRKTASGEKSGSAKVADNANIDIGGKPVRLESLKAPVDASVVYDTELRAVIGIKVAGTESGPAVAPAIEAGSGGEPVGDWSFIPVRGDGKCSAEDALVVTKDGVLICRKLAVPRGQSFSAMQFSIEFRYPTAASRKSANIFFATPGPKTLKLASGPDRLPTGIKVEIALDKCGEIVLPRADYPVELPFGQIRDGTRVARTRQKAATAGQWSRLEIECTAQKNVVVKLNGEVVNALANAEDLTGKVVLNPRDSEEIQFRNATATINGKEEKLPFDASAGR